MLREEHNRTVMLSHILNRAARLYSSRVTSELHEGGEVKDIRPVHLVTMLHLAEEGLRITEVATELNVSKQAVKRVVDELESIGYVERELDPEDRRAKIVTLTKAGETACNVGRETLRRIEENYAEELGEHAVEELWSSLMILMDWLEHLELEDEIQRRMKR